MNFTTGLDVSLCTGTTPAIRSFVRFAFASFRAVPNSIVSSLVSASKMVLSLYATSISRLSSLPVSIRLRRGYQCTLRSDDADGRFYRWSRSLFRSRGVALGEEFRGKGVNVAFGPAMNMARVVNAGRNFEGFGAVRLPFHSCSNTI